MSYLDPIKEAQAVTAIRLGLAAIGEADDDALLTDTIEGQTQLFEVVDIVLERMLSAEVMIEGIEAVEKKLSARKVRYEQRIKSDRALIEQAMTIADLTKIERATATLSLANRPPSLNITEESDIPAEFWKPGDPSLDRKGLTAALKAREKALNALPEDPDERAAAIAALSPEIPGACLSNGAPSITIRRA